MAKQKREYKWNKRKTIRLILFSIFMLVCIYMIMYLFGNNGEGVLDDIKIDEKQNTQQAGFGKERILKLEKLQNENPEIIGWLEIEGTNINYPVLQTKDNDYYLTHNYKKEKAKGGSLFLDKDFNLDKPSTNYLIYGHRMPNGTMFEDLIKYKEESFYKEHPKIRFTTNTEDVEYEIIAVFLSRVYYKSDKNVFRYYYFVDAKNEEEFNQYIENSKRASVYDTKKTAKYGDQLLTLSTCEYSQKDGRFVVVAKRVK